MTISETLVLVSFIAGLIPAIALLLLYGFRTRWTATIAGRAVFALVAMMATSYGLTVLTLVFPEFFLGDDGEWFRIVIRFIIAAVMWNLLLLFFRAQGIGKRRSEQIPDKEQDRYEG
jgi:hypothetical protein